MSNPTVSVIVPAYNHAPYIALALHSLLNQTFTDFEIIIVNDASTDNTLDVIAEFQDPRISCYTLPRNSGLSYTCRHAFSKSKGRYISFLDSDDLWFPQKLERQVNNLTQKPELGANFIYSVVINEDNDIMGTFKADLKNRNRFQWLNRFFTELNPFYGTSVLAKRELMENSFDDRFFNRNDTDWWIKLLLQAEVEIIPDSLVGIRKHSDNSNMSSVHNIESTLRSLVENQIILRNYLNVASLSELANIFPRLRKTMQISKLKKIPEFKKFEKALIQFYVGVAALTSKLPKSGAMISLHRLFGINMLYEVFADKNAREFIEQYCHFNVRDLISLSGKFDIFNRSASSLPIDCVSESEKSAILRTQSPRILKAS